MATSTDATRDAAPAGFAVELNALNPIPESERKGRPATLFWPWFGANVSVLGLGYGAYLLGYGISFAQATIVGILGIVISFLLCGFIAIAGKRGSAPTMVLSRAAFGVNGNRLSSLISWVLTVGWETVLAALAVLATSTVLSALGWGGGTPTKIVSLIVVVVLVIGAGVFGFDIVMRLQVIITVVTGVLTVVYFVLVAGHIHWGAVTALPAGSFPAVIGGLVLMMTGFGLGWVNAAADYSRYLPRSARSGGIVFWTTLGGSVAPLVLFFFGMLLAGSSKTLNTAINGDPIGALATILPTWFLIPFAIVAVLGLIGGAALDIYSSGLSLLSIGVRIPRYAAAGVDGVIMIIGAVYIVFFAGDFIYTFEGFLITLGVPIAAWAGVMLADILLRRKEYDQPALYDPRGRYGSVRWLPVALVVVGTAIGWGLVTNTYASWLTWQGYLLGPLGLGGVKGDWAGANLGVILALLIGFVGTLFSAGAVRRQEGGER
ncbi:purine-cytosine permease family protein [Gryllotalpicola protaetiae]|uniref:Allantoin permease n=1 Tax=Gryllotalpicola protaetiae TaxID=2419771 RepID=A0A387BEU2_9MICO|nr:cytosine permease [Gryllotalpicola protaetiae]AYG02423.1 allantoin permease [Gryllotalpicola protaetiae]